ncbi:hypothetical protein EVAR_27434_1 [Eumeta japonica]|uniref:Uncharacterized protein n=1 Tax=Eumeta variegata TaxID=151549 RepID=A0A4C1VJB4_EUMVA|nr:hypothetical protein EVAR_27434_1 [Eumeta japonica]
MAIALWLGTSLVHQRPSVKKAPRSATTRAACTPFKLIFTIRLQHRESGIGLITAGPGWGPLPRRSVRCSPPGLHLSNAHCIRFQYVARLRHAYDAHGNKSEYRSPDSGRLRGRASWKHRFNYVGLRTVVHH